MLVICAVLVSSQKGDFVIISAAQDYYVCYQLEIINTYLTSVLQIKKESGHTTLVYLMVLVL